MSKIPQSIYNQLEIALVILKCARKIPATEYKTSTTFSSRLIYSSSSGTQSPKPITSFLTSTSTRFISLAYIQSTSSYDRFMHSRCSNNPKLRFFISFNKKITTRLRTVYGINTIFYKTRKSIKLSLLSSSRTKQFSDMPTKIK